ncbi:MAG: MarR family winged helix-turn-helix transcriptional regulator [Candidatus Acidiferrales bacterium]
MRRENATRRLMEFYPRIFFACHARHRRDPKSRRRISAHQGSILDHLDAVEPTSVNGLARHMGVTASTMSLSVDRLERLGYVTRARDAGDRRRVHLRLTSAGVRVKEAQSVLEPDRVHGMLAQLSPTGRDAGIRGLELLARAAERYMASGPPQPMFGLRRRKRRRT